MGTQKPLSKELQDLISLAESDTGVPENERTQVLQEVGAFIYERGIKVGKTRIRPHQIIKLFLESTDSTFPLVYIMSQFGKFFEKKRDYYTFYYLLDPEPFDTSRENRLIYRKLRYRKKRLDEIKKQKKQSKVPRTYSQRKSKNKMGTD